ncbi:MAG: PAS domain-containing sensor histidine kinase [Rhizomicrobium sp.]
MAGPPASAARWQKRSYLMIAGLFLTLLVTALATSWAAIELVNDTRAYATGEGRYSKAEKMAVLDMYRYADSADARDYRAFLEDMTVPRGDRAARLALTQSPPDFAAAQEGFLHGQNHPSDIGGLIRLFRWFSWWQPFVAAREDWRVADGQVAELLVEGRNLQRRISSGRFDARAHTDSLRRIAALDDALTRRENTFSTHMGEAARSATGLVVLILGVSTIVLWAIGTFFATRLFREQLALDRQLEASEGRFRDFAEVASDWYWEMDRSNRITYLSERYFSIISQTADGVMGFDCTALILKNADNPAHRDECLAAIAGRRPFRGLCLRFVAPDGTNGYCAISGKPHLGRTGEFLGYRGTGTDITAQVYDAQSLNDAKTRAEIANRAKSEFLANMSHELRTPLNAILGFSSIIETRMFGDDALERYSDYARDIHNSGAHLLAIINDILDLSKVEAGLSVLEETDVPLDRMVQEARTLLGDGGKNLAFHVDIPIPSPCLRVDERKFVQILVNLLSNAFKFTPAGGSVTLSAVIRADGGLSVGVSDTGIGIAAADLQKVLSPFGQVESAFTRKHQGTGLGLPLAKSLAELHGGTLSLESIDGEGTTVTVSLPRSRVIALQPGTSARA